ncbi:hypothetical protein [Flavobacterium sp.]|uniref:hypothetical protein n=1 Tax=Flavobacterium sp. TaxID=239 RepID=UPI0037505085
MNTQDMKNVMQNFDTIENIEPSENWEVNFQNKLDNARLSKSNSVSKFNLVVLVLIVINAGFVWNSLKTVDTKSEDKGTKYKTIANELLITSNN